MISYISSLRSVENFPMQNRKLVLLGSTGSIGENVLRVVEQFPEQFKIIGLACGENVDLLAQQAINWRPQVLAVKDEQLIKDLRNQLPLNYSPEILVGEHGFMQMASLSEAEMVVSAQVGAVGLAPTISAIESGKIVALANKESLVLSGPILREKCAQSNACILPIDSEHNALFQSLIGHNKDEVTTLVLTASGGPLWGKGKSFLDQVTPEQALNHPNWSMGAKISIDSATLMNKGLEVIEAYYLFGVELNQIQVLVHPESIVHALVKFCDGSNFVHMGIPDMRIPIGYCLSYPKRLPQQLPALDLVKIGKLSFYEPDHELFPCLNLARQALASGKSSPIVLNAANEVAVRLFLDRKIGFQEIYKLNQKSLDLHKPRDISSVKEILDIDKKARELVLQIAKQI